MADLCTTCKHMEPEEYKALVYTGKIAYDAVFDAYYYTDTKEWAEGKCSDPTCEFCAKRPAKAPGNKPGRVRV